MAKTRSFSDIVEALHPGKKGGKTSVDEIIKSFERRGFGPLLLVPALFLALPTGAIPGAPAICGILMILITSQIIVGRDHPWIPQRLRRISFNNGKLKKGLDKAMPLAKKIDQYTGPRFVWLITPLSTRLIATFCLIISIAIIPIGLIPFAADPLAVSIVFFALGITVSDGLLVVTGLAITVIFAVGSVFWW